MRLRSHRFLTAFVLTAALAAGTVAGIAAGTPTAHGDTSAVAINTKDNSSIFRLAFSIKQVMSQTVTDQNAAVAYASCTSCQTVAISIQVLLVGADATTVAPTNLALAVNENCTLCDTLASAYQFVVAMGIRVQLTPEGRQAIAEIRREVRALGREDLTGLEIQQHLDALMTDLGGVLSTQLIPVGSGEQDDGHGDGEAGPGTATDQPPPATGANTAPAQTATEPQSATAPGATTSTPEPSSTAPETSTSPTQPTETTTTSTTTTPTSSTTAPSTTETTGP